LPTNNRQIKLRDGRLLGYAEFGDPDGKPILYFHGAHSSRLSGKVLAQIATKLNARVIAVDRSGLSLSDFKSGRQILDWPDDVIELADALRLSRFAVLGLSSGGPYAAACALRIYQRLTAVSLVSCELPHNMEAADHSIDRVIRLFNFLAREAPIMMRLLLWLVHVGARINLDRFMSQVATIFSETDRKMFDRPGAGQGFIENYLESHRSGIRGAVWDMALVSSRWGFSLQDIPMDVYLWHGEADTAYPLAIGQYISTAIPGCRVEFYPGEGHLSLSFNHKAEIISALVF
jgi:pimeloyl-ACP methyl ester carboxylesterase